MCNTREMTLEEYVSALPSGHRARKEYENITRAPSAAEQTMRKALEKIAETMDTQKGWKAAHNSAECVHIARAALRSIDSGETGESPHWQCQQYIKDAAEASRNAALEEAAKVVPKNWLDLMLTGPRAVIGKPPYGCDDIERVLGAVAAAIRALKTKEQEP